MRRKRLSLCPPVVVMTINDGTTRRASLLCPSISDFDLLSDGERIVDLNPEVTNRALEFGMPERS